MPAKNGAATWITVLACMALLMIGVRVCQAGAQSRAGKLVELAAAKFPNLSRAERAMLAFAQAGNVDRGQYAIAGTSANPQDPSNDPKHSDEWSKDREIRAQLIRWLCEDPQAMQLVGSTGIQVMGARIIGGLNLDLVRAPFGISLAQCSMPGRVSLLGAHLEWVNMAGTKCGEIYGPGLVTGAVFLPNVDSSGWLELDSAKIDGNLYARGAHFRHGAEPIPYMEDLASWKLAVRISYATIRGFVDMTGGFEADGAAQIDNDSIGGDFTLFGSRFINPNDLAFSAASDTIGGEVMLSFAIDGGSHPAQFDGNVWFIDDQIAGGFYGDHAAFNGPSGPPAPGSAPGPGQGLFLMTTSIKGGLWLRGIKLKNGAVLNLGGTSAHAFIDDEAGWPTRGKLLLDGFAYDFLGNPISTEARLRWLGLQDGFNPQPYRQLAKVMAQSGDDAGARQVLIAAEDLRYGQHGRLGRLMGGFLKYSIGYGHRPLRTILWALAIIVLGWIVVKTAARANMMRPTYPENTPPSIERHYESLNPLLYSIDVFFPFVNLHQEHYWWPDSEAAGEWRIFGRSVRFGSLIRYYLWFQIGAGWLLSAIFVAGVTGLIRND